MATSTQKKNKSLGQRLKDLFNIGDSTSAKHATGRATTIPYKANGTAGQILNTSNKPNSTLQQQAQLDDGTVLQTQQGPSTVAVAGEQRSTQVPVSTVAPPLSADAGVVDDGTTYTAVARNPYRVRAPLGHRKRLTPAQLRRLQEYAAKVAAGEAAMQRIPNLLSLAPDFQLPDLPWLCGTWHVTHSTLPMWKDKRNVRISYTRLLGDRLDDVVSFQEDNEQRAAAGKKRKSDKIKSIRGVDHPVLEHGEKGVWNWRGRGLLWVLSSKWEVLGWGGRIIPATELANDPAAVISGEPEMEQWVVTYFAKTLFTPAGIDIYSRRQQGLSPDTLRKLIEGLKKVDADAVRLARIQPPGSKDTDLSIENAAVDVQPDSDELAATSAPGGYGDFSKLVDTLFEVKQNPTKDGVIVIT